jgi:hypothetical protein
MLDGARRCYRTAGAYPGFLLVLFRCAYDVSVRSPQATHTAISHSQEAIVCIPTFRNTHPRCVVCKKRCRLQDVYKFLDRVELCGPSGISVGNSESERRSGRPPAGPLMGWAVSSAGEGRDKCLTGSTFAAISSRLLERSCPTEEHSPSLHPLETRKVQLCNRFGASWARYGTGRRDS